MNDPTFWEQIIRAAPGGVQVLDAEGQVVLANPALLDLLGYTEDEYVGRPLADFDPGRALRDALGDRREVRNLVVSLKGRNGATRHVSVDVVPLGDRSCWYLADITEHRRERDKLAQVVDSAEDAIIALGLDGTIETWNRSAGELFGLETGEVLGQSVFVTVPEGRRADELRGMMEKIRHGEHIKHYETQRLHKDGHPLEVSISLSPMHDEDGHLVGISKITRDIGEALGVKRRAEEQARLIERQRGELARRNAELA